MEEIKLCVFVDYVLLYTENPKKSTHKKKFIRANKWVQQGFRV